MIEYFPFIVIALLALALIFLILLLRRPSEPDNTIILSRLDSIEKAEERTEQTVRDELSLSREEFGKTAREQRQELAISLKTFGDSVAQRIIDLASFQKRQLDDFSKNLALFAKVSGEKLDMARAEAATGAKQLREEVISALKGIAETTNKTMSDLSGMQKVQLEAMSTAIVKLSEKNDKKLEDLRCTVEARLQNMQADNTKQLDQMRQTVDEKLQGTLEKRLGESFKHVSERLEQVHKGLGEMQSLATGVGDLKKVLTNVKTRGTWGEVQLGALLDQVLNSDQFSTNVATKEGGERVEFAVRLPGQGDERDETVWLPIDAKFPIEDYHRLLEAQDAADAAGVESPCGSQDRVDEVWRHTRFCSEKTHSGVGNNRESQSQVKGSWKKTARCAGASRRGI